MNDKFNDDFLDDENVRITHEKIKKSQNFKFDIDIIEKYNLHEMCVNEFNRYKQCKIMSKNCSIAELSLLECIKNSGKFPY